MAYPMGWPRATAPPFTFTRSGSMFNSCKHTVAANAVNISDATHLRGCVGAGVCTAARTCMLASTTQAKASLISWKSMSSVVTPAWARALGTARAGAVVNSIGACAASAKPVAATLPTTCGQPQAHSDRAVVAPPHPYLGSAPTASHPTQQHGPHSSQSGAWKQCMVRMRTTAPLWRTATRVLTRAEAPSFSDEALAAVTLPVEQGRCGA